MELDLDHLAIAVLVVLRIASLVLVAPMFGTFAVPVRARIAVVLALAALIVPVEVGLAHASPATLPAFLTAAGGEILIGLLLGLGVRILFAGMHVAGQAVGQMSGLQLAEVVSPGWGGGIGAVSQLLFCVTTAVFLVIGGHRQVIEALLDTFAWLPAGQGAASGSAVEAATTLVAHSFELGLRAAAPALVALLVATLIVGVVGRAVPQVGGLSLGFGVNVLVALVAITFTMGGACWLFQEQIDGVLQTALVVLRPN